VLQHTGHMWHCQDQSISSSGDDKAAWQPQKGFLHDTLPHCCLAADAAHTNLRSSVEAALLCTCFAASFAAAQSSSHQQAPQQQEQRRHRKAAAQLAAMCVKG
jgi:hypothetical protein